MIHSTLRNPPVTVTPAMSPPAAVNPLALQSALHDMNNLLLIMSTYTALAVDKLSVDSSAYRDMRQAKEAVSQAALLAHEIRIALK
ncbi:MAG: hypothetical protein NT075_25000 [Chloroflexi bacterium]|nr:hypothetical protein [Chloroflexota bacterium]